MDGRSPILTQIVGPLLSSDVRRSGLLPGRIGPLAFTNLGKIDSFVVVVTVQAGGQVFGFE
ncbi:MAG: hypothetical protein DWH91_05705 [Planctomycetota bacterium]|nr:MAG: hypothetical protein DWH91_05705 [Planctomycetota bacterium]